MYQQPDQQQQQYQHPQTILAIDYGTRVVGTAIYKTTIDPMVQMHQKILFKNNNELIKEIQKIIDEEAITILVIGVPYHLDGNPSAMTQQILQFKNECQLAFKIPIYTQDETLSSEAAKDRMINSPRFQFKFDPKLVDLVAAVIILEDFISENSALFAGPI